MIYHKIVFLQTEHAKHKILGYAVSEFDASTIIAVILYHVHLHHMTMPTIQSRSQKCNDILYYVYMRAYQSVIKNKCLFYCTAAGSYRYKSTIQLADVYMHNIIACYYMGCICTNQLHMFRNWYFSGLLMIQLAICVKVLCNLQLHIQLYAS